MPTLEFSLTDQDGNSVHATDLRGKLVLLYFGYTHCPDVCPTTLTVLSQAVKQLGSQADKVRVLFVTVDPARDTESLLKRYAPSFGPQVMGLRGDGQELARLTKRFRVTYGLGKPDADGNYEVSHSSAVFVFDRKGEARLLGRFADTAVAYAHDLKQLLKEG
jgi:protein SCO1/2